MNRAAIEAPRMVESRAGLADLAMVRRQVGSAPIDTGGRRKTPLTFASEGRRTGDAVAGLLRKGECLAGVKYFTARVRGDAGKIQRQGMYLKAIATLPGVDVFFGHYLVSQRTCRECGHVFVVFGEKMTDVNIATRLILDAVDHKFDRAIIVSGDSDLAPPIFELRNRYPEIEITVAFPPNRISKELEKVASGHFHIGADKLRKNQFPESVEGAGRIYRPPRWK